MNFSCRQIPVNNRRAIGNCLRLHTTFTFFFLLLFSFTLPAQRITHIGAAQGINGQQTFNIVQDKKGFLWISTRFGVDRFDGLNVKNYFMDILYNGTMPIRTIRVELDRNADLWAYTDRGTIYKYNNDRDEFVVHKDLKTYIRWLCFDSNNNIWVTTGREIGILKDSTLQLLQALQKEGTGYRRVFLFDKEDLMLINNEQILLYNTRTKQSSPFIDSKLLKEKGMTPETCLYEPATGKAWIGTINKGLFVYDINSKALSPVGDSRLWYHPVLSMTRFDKDHILVGTEGMGAYLFNTNDLRIEKFYNQQSEEKTRISGNAVYDVYKDAEGKVWLSTFSDGVSILDFSDRGFQTIQHEKNNPNSLSRDIVCDILEDSNGILWFATNNDLCFWNRKTNQWKKVLNETNVLTLYEDSRHDIWVGTYSSGVYQLNKQGAVIAHYMIDAGSENSIGTNFVYAIAEDEEGNLWFGGKRGNVSKFIPSSKSFTTIAVTQANHIIRKDAHTMLVSTESGVYEVTTDTKSRKDCAFNAKLKSRYISDMYLQSDSIIWIGTYGNGLNRCNLQTGTVTVFSQKNGLPSDIIYAIEKDEANNLWFSSENGISRFDLSTFQVENFSAADGISGNRFRQLSKAKSVNGDLYFGSYSGATFFNPKTIARKKDEAHLSLQNFWLFNQIVKAGDPHSPLSHAMDDTKSITLDHNQHSFSIDFVGIDYSLGKTRRYLWKLENLDQNWVGPTSEHIANYTNLSPNDYIFRVKYLDENNNLLDEKAVTIKVLPPFWDTVWARILIAIILVVIAWLVYRYVRQKVQERQTAEKIRFFVNTAHDIRTPLTLIGAPIYELKEQIQPSAKNNYLMKLVTENLDKLNRMFSQLLDFQKAYESRDQLVIQQRDIKKYLTKKLDDWQAAAHTKRIMLSLELPLQEIAEWFDAEKMDKILDNLISNAVKYTPEGGKVNIVLSADQHFWQIAVADNGIGISRQDRKNLFKRFYRAGNAVNKQIAGSGLGLMLVEKYVALHKGNITVDSAENQGTTFRLQFRRGNKHYRNNIILDDQNLPVIDEKDMTDEEAPVNTLKVKILVVEDNPELRSFMEISLGHYYQVFTAENGVKAWEEIGRVHPDIIISDLNMPEMDGLQLCEKVKTTFETSHLPVILLTVETDKASVKKGLHSGADDYIEKPFDTGYLRLKVDTIIQNRKLLRQKFLNTDDNATAESPVSGNELNDGFIEKATAIIEKNMSNTAFSVSDFSKEMAVSRTLLYTKFNAITGFTPNDFIKIVRMKKAIAYFKEKKHSINEVALMVGFDEPAYFSTCFKKIYGKSPRKFIEEDLT